MQTKVGDYVRYNNDFLNRAVDWNLDIFKLNAARGFVVKEYGVQDTTKHNIVKVKWNYSDVPEIVNSGNLSLVNESEI